MVGPTSARKSASGTKGEFVNYDDPLYIHPSDNNVTTIINFKLIRVENLCIWCSSMTRSVKALNKLDFVDRTIKKDSDDKLKTLITPSYNHAFVLPLSSNVPETIESNYKPKLSEFPKIPPHKHILA